MKDIPLRIATIEEYLGNRITGFEAGRRLGLHRVSFWRILKKYESAGPRGLEHGLRGRPSNNAKIHRDSENREMT
ncbi:MAG TPA: hypothetical protein VLJ37_08725 [bacterium]|nr:hypothetical protein [bacterium]